MKTNIYSLNCLYILLSLIPVSLRAQTPILSLPLCYQKPHYKQTCDLLATTTFSWIVYSDRPSNISLIKSDGQPSGKFIDFMDRFFVTERKGNFLHIYRDEMRAYREKALTTGAEDFGWIALDRVLPSRFCFLNEQNVYMKAVLLNAINSKKSNISQNELKLVRFYKDPNLKNLTPYTCSIYSFFYIYKIFPEFPKEGKAMLLGTKPRFEPSDTSAIKGWVDIKDLLIWDFRLFVYPNSNDDAIKERKERKLKSIVLVSLQSAKKLQNGEQLNKEDNIIWDNDLYIVKDSLNPYLMRFPVIEKLKDGMLKLGVFNAQNFSSNMSNLKTFPDKSGTSSKDFKVLTTENSGYWLEGYSPIATKVISHPIWGFELFYTQKDLGELINSMDKMQYVDNEITLRENFIKVWGELIKNHTGKFLSVQNLQEMSFGEIEELAFGGVGTSSILLKKT